MTKRFHHGTVDGGDGSVGYYRFTLSEAREVGIGLRRLDHNADVSIEDDAGTVLHRGTNAAPPRNGSGRRCWPGPNCVRVEAGDNSYVLSYGIRDADPDELARLQAEAIVFVNNDPGEVVLS